MEFKYTQRSLEAASVAGGEGGGGGGRKRGCHVRIVNWPPFSFRQRGRETEREREGERIISRNTILSSLLSVTHAANRGERERERGVYEREKLRRGRKNEDRKHFQSVN